MTHRKLFWQVNHPNADRILYDPEDNKIVGGITYNTTTFEWTVRHRNRMGDDFESGDSYTYDLMDKARDAVVAAVEVAMAEKAIVVPEPHSLVNIYAKALRSIIVGGDAAASTVRTAQKVLENPAKWLVDYEGEDLAYFE